MSDKNPKINKNTFFCSFCSKSQNDVTMLIRGGSALICEECVSLCVNLMCQNLRFQYDAAHPRLRKKENDDKVDPSLSVEITAQDGETS